jgi:hypothetical protein
MAETQRFWPGAEQRRRFFLGMLPRFSASSFRPLLWPPSASPMVSKTAVCLTQRRAMRPGRFIRLLVYRNRIHKST